MASLWTGLMLWAFKAILRTEYFFIMYIKDKTDLVLFTLADHSTVKWDIFCLGDTMYQQNVIGISLVLIYAYGGCCFFLYWKIYANTAAYFPPNSNMFWSVFVSKPTTRVVPVLYPEMPDKLERLKFLNFKFTEEFLEIWTIQQKATPSQLFQTHFKSPWHCLFTIH